MFFVFAIVNLKAAVPAGDSNSALSWDILNGQVYLKTIGFDGQ